MERERQRGRNTDDERDISEKCVLLSVKPRKRMKARQTRGGNRGVLLSYYII